MILQHKKSWVVKIALLVLASCAPPIIPSVTPLTSPAKTLAVSNPSAPVMSGTQTPDVNSKVPTKVALLRTLTPRPTFPPTATLPAKTLSAIATASTFFPLCNGFPITWNLAPNGHWIASVCERDATDPNPYVDVFNSDRSFYWKIPFDTKGGALDGYIFPFHWSKDGHYLYLTPALIADGMVYFKDGDGLLRLNLQTGQVSEIIKTETSGLRFYALSFSPSEKMLAYIYHGETPLILRILNVQTGEKTKISLPEAFLTAGAVLWSSDESQVVYAMSTDFAEGFGLVWLNLISSEQRIFLTPQDKLLNPIEWKDKNTVLAESRLGDDEFWLLNLETGEFSLK